ncbi:hypothetical protein WA556_001893, partial [Blastocystis sp. ATCC 50177/Nand II]
MLKPTKMKRDLFVTITVTATSVSLFLGILLFWQIEYLELIKKNHYSWFSLATKLIIVSRCVTIFLTFFAAKKNSLPLWNLSSTLLFLAYFVAGVMDVYTAVVARDLSRRVLSIGLLIAEFFMNCISFIGTMILTYQTIVSSSSSTPSDLVSPQKEFILFAIESLVTVLPGIGVFGKKLIKAVKVD